MPPNGEQVTLKVDSELIFTIFDLSSTDDPTKPPTFNSAKLKKLLEVVKKKLDKPEVVDDPLFINILLKVVGDIVTKLSEKANEVQVEIEF